MVGGDEEGGDESSSEIWSKLTKNESLPFFPPNADLPTRVSFRSPLARTLRTVHASGRKLAQEIDPRRCWGNSEVDSCPSSSSSSSSFRTETPVAREGHRRESASERLIHTRALTDLFFLIST